MQYEEDDETERREIASMRLADFLLDEDEMEDQSDESLWNPNGDDMDEFLGDMLWD